MFGINYSHFSWCLHVQYSLQRIVVVLTCSVWYTANCCGAERLVWCSDVQYCFHPIVMGLKIRCGGHMFRMVYSELFWCLHIHYNLQPIVVVLTYSVWFQISNSKSFIAIIVHTCHSINLQAASELVWYGWLGGIADIYDEIITHKLRMTRYTFNKGGEKPNKAYESQVCITSIFICI